MTIDNPSKKVETAHAAAGGPSPLPPAEENPQNRCRRPLRLHHRIGRHWQVAKASSSATSPESSTRPVAPTASSSQPPPDSIAGVSLGKADRELLFNMVAGNEAACKRWRSAEALVIDVVDGELFDNLECIARNLRHESRDFVWGGIQLVVCGDFFQLPPVDPTNPKKEFAFEADCWGHRFDIQVELLQNYRHSSDTRLIELLQGSRSRRTDPEHLSALSERCTKRLGASRHVEPSVPQIYPRHGDARRVNEERG
ncbi:DNA helicase [Asimina triloba]